MKPATMLDVGKKKLCEVCLDKGIEIEIHAVEKTSSFGTKYSWKNDNGATHCKPSGVGEDGKPKFVHQTNEAQPEQKGSGSIPTQERFDEATDGQKGYLKSIIEKDDLYQAVAVSQVNKRGSTVRGDIVAHEKEMLIRLRQLEILEQGITK